MKDIRISPLGQLIGALAVVGTIAAAVAAQRPELRRYMKVRAMD